jgi:nucleoid DNA-binding protein
MIITKASKNEIVGEVAKRSALKKEVVGHVYYKLAEVILDKLKEGKEVMLPGIGTFHFADKKSSISNLDKQVIPPHKQIKFRFNKLLARYIRVISREINHY